MRDVVGLPAFVALYRIMKLLCLLWCERANPRAARYSRLSSDEALISSRVVLVLWCPLLYSLIESDVSVCLAAQIGQSGALTCFFAREYREFLRVDRDCTISARNLFGLVPEVCRIVVSPRPGAAPTDFDSVIIPVDLDLIRSVQSSCCRFVLWIGSGTRRRSLLRRHGAIALLLRRLRELGRFMGGDRAGVSLLARIEPRLQAASRGQVDVYVNVI